jgi:hypothetical protein
MTVRFFLAERNVARPAVENGYKFKIVDEYSSAEALCYDLEARDVLDGVFKCFTSAEMKLELLVKWNKTFPREVDLAIVYYKEVPPSFEEREEFLAMLIDYLKYWVEVGKVELDTAELSVLTFQQAIKLVPKLSHV